MGAAAAVVPFSITVAVRFAWGTGIEDRSRVLFCRSAVWVELRSCVLKPSMIDAKSDELTSGSL